MQETAVENNRVRIEFNDIIKSVRKRKRDSEKFTQLL